MEESQKWCDLNFEAVDPFLFFPPKKTAHRSEYETRAIPFIRNVIVLARGGQDYIGITGTGIIYNRQIFSCRQDCVRALIKKCLITRRS